MNLLNFNVRNLVIAVAIAIGSLSFVNDQNNRPTNLDSSALMGIWKVQDTDYKSKLFTLERDLLEGQKIQDAYLSTKLSLGTNCSFKMNKRGESLKGKWVVNENTSYISMTNAGASAPFDSFKVITLKPRIMKLEHLEANGTLTLELKSTNF